MVVDCDATLYCVAAFAIFTETCSRQGEENEQNALLERRHPIKLLGMGGDERWRRVYHEYHRVLKVPRGRLAECTCPRGDFFSDCAVQISHENNV